MDPAKLICSTNNITYNKGYIVLWLENFPLPETLTLNNETLVKKDHFHVSLVCVKNILALKPAVEADLLQHVCDFLQHYELTFTGFTGECRVAKDTHRKSLAALCTVTNLANLTDYLSNKLGIPLADQPAHVTLYTRQPNIGIGLNSLAEMGEKSTLTSVPEDIQSILDNQ